MVEGSHRVDYGKLLAELNNFDYVSSLRAADMDMPKSNSFGSICTTKDCILAASAPAFTPRNPHKN